MSFSENLKLEYKKEVFFGDLKGILYPVGFLLFWTFLKAVQHYKNLVKILCNVVKESVTEGKKSITLRQLV